MGSHGREMILGIKLNAHSNKIIRCNVDRLSFQCDFNPKTIDRLVLGKLTNFTSPSSWSLFGEWHFLKIKVKDCQIDNMGKITLGYTLDNNQYADIRRHFSGGGADWHSNVTAIECGFLDDSNLKHLNMLRERLDFVFTPFEVGALTELLYLEDIEEGTRYRPFNCGVNKSCWVSENNVSQFGKIS